MTGCCPLCGARFPGELACRERYELALALEFGDPAYFAVHHLSIPAYLLQHNQYSRRGWLWARASLADLIRNGVAPNDLRQRQRQRSLVDSGNRDWRVTDGPRPEWFSGIVWTRTIADVRFESPDIYGADVRAWATAVLDDTDAIVSRVSSHKGTTFGK